MYNKFMKEKELNVKVGNRVRVCGWDGTVTEVIKTNDCTEVRVHFDDDGIGAQYQNEVYGGYTVL